MATSSQISAQAWNVYPKCINLIKKYILGEKYNMPICLNCNKEFPKHRERCANKYCSKDCYNKCKEGPKVFWENATQDQIMERLKFYFEKKVIRKESCWDWEGSFNRGGYGLISIKGINRVASRVSWMIHKGEIPEGLLVLHSCDNPKCTNPDHLFLGTHKDNAIDRVNKGRNRNQFGENNSSSILTNDKVLEIRKLCEQKVSHKQIAIKFNVTLATIYDINRRKIWRHI